MDFGSALSAINPVAAVGSVAGDLGSAYMNYKANSLNRDVQQSEFAQSALMANTAHEREVKDLIAAGLNPMLSATGGRGLEAPSGGSVSSLPINVDVGKDLNSAMSVTRTQKEIDQMDATISNLQQQVKTGQSQASSFEASAAASNAAADRTRTDTELAPGLALAAIKQANAAAVSAEASRRNAGTQANTGLNQGALFQQDVLNKKIEAIGLALNNILTRMEIPRAGQESDFYSTPGFGSGYTLLQKAVNLISPLLGGVSTAVGGYAANKKLDTYLSRKSVGSK